MILIDHPFFCAYRRCWIPNRASRDCFAVCRIVGYVWILNLYSTSHQTQTFLGSSAERYYSGLIVHLRQPLISNVNFLTSNF